MLETPVNPNSGYSNYLNVPFYSLAPQHKPNLEKFEAATRELINSSQFIQGAAVQEFEQAWAKYCGKRYCIGVGNGLEAITLVLKALDLDPKKKVITVANSFIASALGATNAGLNVDLVDCAEDYLIDVAALEKLDPNQVSCLIPVHLFGQMADMKKIQAWAVKHKIAVIEDSAQAHGAKREDYTPGDLSVAATYSFYPGKNLGAMGDAGAIVTNDEALATKIKKLRSYGSTVKYHHEFLGTNSRLDTLQAHFLSIKLPFLDSWNAQRNEIASYYNEALSGIGGLRIPTKIDHSYHVYHQYVVEVSDRDQLQAHLEKLGITTLIHYPIPIHQAKAYKDILSNVVAPNSERFAKRILSLPIWPGMSAEMLEHVVKSIRAYYSAPKFNQ